MQVRKTSQAALLVLLEQDLVSRGDVYSQVCPVIIDLTEPVAIDDFRTEAVAVSYYFIVINVLYYPVAKSLKIFLFTWLLCYYTYLYVIDYFIALIQW